MILTDLPRVVDQLSSFNDLVRQLGIEGAPFAAEIEGLAGPAKGFALARLYARLERPLLIVTYQHEQAQRLWDDLIRFGVPADRACVLPSAQSLFLEGDVTDYRAIGERIGALTLLARNEPCIVIGTVEAVLQRSSPPEDLIPFSFTLQAGQEVDYSDILARLVKMGYQSAATVTRPGEFSRRGGILDVYSSTADAPVRIELFGDEIESLRIFDVTTQRSIGRRAEVDVAPAREVRLNAESIQRAVAEIQVAFGARKAALARENTPQSRESVEQLRDRVEQDLGQLGQGVYFDGLEQYFHYLVPTPVCAADYLPRRGVVILDEPNQVRDHWDRLAADMASARLRRWERGESLDVELNSCDYASTLESLASHPMLVLSLLGRAVEGVRIRQRVTVNSAPMDTYRGRLSGLADETGAWL